MIELIKLPIDPMDITNQTPFLARWFPNLFADALIPINPIRWPAYITGSAMASDMPEFGDKLQTSFINLVFINLVVVKEYLETSKSDIQLWKVIQDTTAINLSCEIGQDVGTFGAGGMSTKIADGYVEEMVEASFTLRKSEKLNEMIYKQFAGEQGLGPSLVNGTGPFRQFVPVASRGNILDRPPRGSRPLWAKKPYSSVIHHKGRGPLGSRSTATGQ